MPFFKVMGRMKLSNATYQRASGNVYFIHPDMSAFTVKYFGNPPNNESGRKTTYSRKAVKMLTTPMHHLTINSFTTFSESKSIQRIVNAPNIELPVLVGAARDKIYVFPVSREYG